MHSFVKNAQIIEGFLFVISSEATGKLTMEIKNIAIYFPFK
jgi:hypothetical protein